MNECLKKDFRIDRFAHLKRLHHQPTDDQPTSGHDLCEDALNKAGYTAGLSRMVGQEL